MRRLSLHGEQASVTGRGFEIATLRGGDPNPQSHQGPHVKHEVRGTGAVNSEILLEKDTSLRWVKSTARPRIKAG